MDTHARYTPQFTASPHPLHHPPRLPHFESPYASILSFTFQDAYQRQNASMGVLHGLRCTAFGNMKRIMGETLPASASYLHKLVHGAQGFIFYETMSQILGFGLVNHIDAWRRVGLVGRIFPDGLKGLLLYGQYAPISGTPEAYDVYGALDLRGTNARQWTANAFLGTRIHDALRFELNTRIREVNLPQMHSAAVNAVYTLYRRLSDEPNPKLERSIDFGVELSLVEGMPNNAFTALRMQNILLPKTTFVAGLTLLGHVRLLYGYPYADYLKFASLFEMHLTTYRSDAIFAAQLIPHHLPRSSQMGQLFHENAVLRYIHSVTGRLDVDKGLAWRVELASSPQTYSVAPSKARLSLTCEMPYPGVENWLRKVALGADLEIEW